MNRINSTVFPSLCLARMSDKGAAFFKSAPENRINDEEVLVAGK